MGSTTAAISGLVYYGFENDVVTYLPVQSNVPTRISIQEGKRCHLCESIEVSDVNGVIYCIDHRSLFNLLNRPECVRAYGKSLYSNPFWKAHTPENRKSYSEEVKQATLFLYTKLIPDFARYLEVTPFVSYEEREARGDKGEDLILMLHQAGINCRHLGRLLEELSPDCEWRNTVIEEMIARTFKV